MCYKLVRPLLGVLYMLPPNPLKNYSKEISSLKSYISLAQIK